MSATFLGTGSPSSTTVASSCTTIEPLSIFAGIPACCNSPRIGPGGKDVSPAGTTISAGAIAPAFAGASVLLSSKILNSLKGFISVKTIAG